VSDTTNPVAPGDDPGASGQMPPDTLTMNSVPGAGSIGDDDLTSEISAADAELTPSDGGDAPAPEAVRDPSPGVEPNE
jgi:hypothetical protein